MLSGAAGLGGSPLSLVAALAAADRRSGAASGSTASLPSNRFGGRFGSRRPTGPSALASRRPPSLGAPLPRGGKGAYLRALPHVVTAGGGPLRRPPSRCWSPEAWLEHSAARRVLAKRRAVPLSDDWSALEERATLCVDDDDVEGFATPGGASELEEDETWDDDRDAEGRDGAAWGADARGARFVARQARSGASTPPPAFSGAERLGGGGDLSPGLAASRATLTLAQQRRRRALLARSVALAAALESLVLEKTLGGPPSDVEESDPEDDWDEGEVFGGDSWGGGDSRRRRGADRAAASSSGRAGVAGRPGGAPDPPARAWSDWAALIDRMQAERTASGGAAPVGGGEDAGGASASPLSSTLVRASAPFPPASAPSRASASAAASSSSLALPPGASSGQVRPCLGWLPPPLRAGTPSWRLSRAESLEDSRFAFGKSGVHGWGLFARVPIAADEPLCEYRGEVVSRKEAEAREKRYKACGMDCYLFAVDDAVVVDATVAGNLARLTNHSCEPSVYARIVDAGGRPRLVFFARKAVAPGQELGFNYRFQAVPGEARLPCSCGAPSCDGYLD